MVKGDRNKTHNHSHEAPQWLVSGESTIRLTNRFNLPEPFVAAVSSDDYERGDAEYTATELIKPSRIVAYSRKYDSVMTEDASDRVWRFQGQTKHVVLERIAKTNPLRYLVEQRFETTMPGTGAIISGKIDLFDCQDGILYDWKETSVWKFMMGDTEEWEQQANINLHLMRSYPLVNPLGLPAKTFALVQNPKKLINIAILKDWKARQARFSKDPDYPKCAVHVMPLPMWSIGQAQDYINKRVEKHRAEAADPPVCNKKERWQRDASFAVMRTDRKRALRLYQNRDQAEAALIQAARIAPPGDAKKFFIEERNAEPVRCLDFCGVQLQCDFGTEAEKKWKEKHKSHED
jgi:hypothetical protein